MWSHPFLLISSKAAWLRNNDGTWVSKGGQHCTLFCRSALILLKHVLVIKSSTQAHVCSCLSKARDSGVVSSHDVWQLGVKLGEWPLYSSNAKNLVTSTDRCQCTGCLHFLRNWNSAACQAWTRCEVSAEDLMTADMRWVHWWLTIHLVLRLCMPKQVTWVSSMVLTYMIIVNTAKYENDSLTVDRTMHL